MLDPCDELSDAQIIKTCYYAIVLFIGCFIQHTVSVIPSGKQECVMLYFNCTQHDSKQVNTLHSHSTSVPFMWFKKSDKFLYFAIGPLMLVVRPIHTSSLQWSRAGVAC